MVVMRRYDDDDDDDDGAAAPPQPGGGAGGCVWRTVAVLPLPPSAACVVSRLALDRNCIVYD